MFKSAKFISNTRPLRLSAEFSVINDKTTLILTLSGGLVDGSHSGYSVIEYGGDMDVVPFLSHEGVSAIMETITQEEGTPTASSWFLFS